MTITNLFKVTKTIQLSEHLFYLQAINLADIYYESKHYISRKPFNITFTKIISVINAKI